MKTNRIIKLYVLYLIISTITIACCVDNHRIIGKGAIKTVDKETHEIFHGDITATITGEFRIDWTLEFMQTGIFNDFNIINSAYATSCDDNYENDVDIASFKLIADKDFTYNTTIIPEGYNLIQLDNINSRINFYGTFITFSQEFMNNAEFLDDIYEFRLEINTTDGLELENTVHLQFEIQ
jgi:hypothetical protein